MQLTGKAQKHGIETVSYNKYKYIVHPAFETNTDIGGWKKDLSGIWLGKYESAKDTATESNYSRSDNCGGSGTSIKIVPNVTSWRLINIGNCYTKAKEYDDKKESHLMKNSEWGAVAYLTHSQYGRNGNEVNINDLSGYITGSGKGSADKNLSSSTGNIYGVYDLSGGAWEYVAAYNEGTTSSNGESLTGETEQQYVTKYKSSDETPSYDKYYSGDATYEVYTRSDRAWFDKYLYFVYSSKPFFRRGNTGDYDNAGVFNANNYDGSNTYGEISFRVVLTGVQHLRRNKPVKLCKLKI